MIARLLIRFQPALWPRVTWALVNKAGIITLGPQQNTLAEIPQPQNGETITILVPGADVLIMSVNLPYSSHMQLRKATPYALEDQLIADIETQHFALGSIQLDKAVHVAVIAKQQLQDWLAALQEANIQPEIMLPDYLAIPYEEGAWTMVLEPQSALIRTDKEVGYSVAPEYLKLFFRSLIAKAKTDLPERLLINNTSPSPIPDLSEFNIPILEEKATESFLTTAAKVLVQPIPILNLLQGEFHTDHKFVQLKKRWQIAAILAASWLLVLFLGHGISYFYLKHTQQKLEAQLNTLYQKVLPNAVAPKSRASVEQELTQLKKIDTSPSFINLLSKAGTILKSSPNINLLAMNYEKPQLTLQIKSNANTLEQLLHHFAADGLKTRSEKTNNPSAGVKIYLQMGAKK
ncbi:MAG: type II secretion system protein GspL [Gammaproteobacteria bacterium]